MTTAPPMAGEHYWIGTNREFELGIDMQVPMAKGKNEVICPVSIAGHDIFLHAFTGDLKFYIVDEARMKRLGRRGLWTTVKRLLR